ncbi:uncharacterized protein LOC132705084 [Cylas formicarius]|uniref:uncharacterized protein LOC132705084 n=1 Tax=Cylas formicarius TaxID=197179 RepID=UPI00295840A4|nr:uncharacterized protein LOC132705084 [Cylas formicarius]
MVFDVADKVALVTGSASGMGFKFCKEFLRRGVKGVVLADVDKNLGEIASKEIAAEFGKGKAIFVETDISDKRQFEEAFKSAIRTFGQIDILVNNAGILNDAQWEREISINVKGTVNGMILGLEHYLQKYKSGLEAVIVNVCSVSGIEPLDFFPIYCGTKFAIHGLTLSWGLPSHYERTKVRVVALCPGRTKTPLIEDTTGKFLLDDYKKAPVDVALLRKFTQTADQVAPRMIEIIEKADPGTAWVVEGGDAPYKFVLPNRFEIVEKVYVYLTRDYQSNHQIEEMVFDIKSKVALISGGASGIGLRYAKELLKHGAKGVVLADVDSNLGATALTEIDRQFGKNKAIFVTTDVTDFQQFENAFKKTVETFKNVDILINNAGILNDETWAKEISINLNGVVHGVLLGLENYLQKYKSGSEAVVVNISSIAGVEPYAAIPIYCATKFAVLGMSLSWGLPFHYQRTKVRVVAICPGVTDTPLIGEMAGRNLSEAYEEIRLKELQNCKSQKPEYVAAGMITVLQKAESGTIWIIEANEAPYQFVLPDRFKFTDKIFLK